MTTFRTAVAAAAIAAVLALSGCSGSTDDDGDVIAPVVMSAEELQGATVTLEVGQVLDITTGDLAVDSYSGEVDDPSIAEFTAGYEDGGAEFNPGVTALEAGETGVVLTNEDGGIEPVSFTVTVTE